MSEDEIIGHIEIQELRRKFQDNYIVYVLIDKPIQHLGEFDENEWNYAYLLDIDEFEIRKIEEAKSLPRELNTLLKAIEEVTGDKLYAYKITLWSKLTRREVQNKMEDWLKEELETRKIIIDVIKLPKVIKRKRIPITKSIFEKILRK